MATEHDAERLAVDHLPAAHLETGHAVVETSGGSAFRVVRTGPAAIGLTVVGDLDVANVAGLRAVVLDLLARGLPGLIEVDLSAVDFIDVTTVRELLGLYRRAGATGCRLAITNAQESTWWLLDTLGLTAAFPRQASRHHTGPGT
jgi:anti-anti-sigma factor